MTDNEREAAWDAVHAALPAGWVVSNADPPADGDEWYVSAVGPRPGPGKPYPTLTGSGGDQAAALRDLESKLRRGPPAGGVYVGPGIEAGCLIVPLVAVIGAVAGVVVASSAAASDGLRVGLAAFVAGVVGWIALWELFARLHPRFSTGRGDRIKWALVVAGPPVLAMAAAVATR